MTSGIYGIIPYDVIYVALQRDQRTDMIMYIVNARNLA